MGSNLKSSLMPESKRNAFLEVFSKLKQHVLWKWETDTLPGQPKNVKLGKWLPQSDILGECSCLRIVLKYVRFHILTAASIWLRTFWDISSYNLGVNRRFRAAYCLHYHPDEKSSTHLLNVDLLQRDNTTLYHRRLSYSCTEVNLSDLPY
jgi:hypothetical protein